MANLHALIVITLLVLGSFFGWQAIDQKDFSLRKVSIPTPFNLSGIDVSHHQGPIDWQVVKSNNGAGKIDFVYIKLTEGKDHTDKQYLNNHAGLLANQLQHGGYHFLTNLSSPKDQAQHFLRHYNPSEYQLPPVLDVELQNIPASKLVPLVAEWIQEVENSSGQRVMIYCPLKLYRDVLKKNFPTHNFWLASYSSTPSEINDPQVLIWQYSETGRLESMKGNIDLNYGKIGLVP